MYGEWYDDPRLDKGNGLVDVASSEAFAIRQEYETLHGIEKQTEKKERTETRQQYLDNVWNSIGTVFFTSIALAVAAMCLAIVLVATVIEKMTEEKDKNEWL